MSKSLEDFKVEITQEKTDGQVVKIVDYKNYRATEAIVFGIVGFLVVIILKFAGPSIWNFRIDTIDEYIEFRKSIWWFAIAERVIWIKAITSYANKLNRNPLGWQFFAFFTPYLALIVIGLSKRNNNFFYEYMNAGDKLDFFNSLSYPEMFLLYNHLLSRANTSIFPYWWNEMISLNAILFADENSSLSTLQQYELMFGKNLIKVLLEKMPSNMRTREQLFAPLEKHRLLTKALYQPAKAPLQ
jgi:hypothetical protein